MSGPVPPTRFRFAKVKVTNDCNSRCLTCDYWRETHSGELSRDELLSVLLDLRSLGIEEVMFTGGEPTIRAELPELVAAARSEGFLGIGLTTNGLSLSRSKAERLIDSGLTEIVFSLEGLESHDEVRGVPGNAAKILGHLAWFQEIRSTRGPRPAVKIAMTLMGRNLGEVPGVVDLARRHGATLFFNLIDRGTYFFRGAPLDLFHIADRAQLDALIDELVEIKKREPALLGNTISSLEYARAYFGDPLQKDVPCYLGLVGIDIDANGDVYSNCWGLPPVGNVRATPLARIVGSPGYEERCRAMLAKRCPGCSCGYILNLAQHPPAVRLDRSHGADGSRERIGYAGTRPS